MLRREFIKDSTVIATGVVLGASGRVHEPVINKIPRWRGFNLTDFNSIDPNNDRRKTTEQHLKWMTEWGFNFVRLPISYPYYVEFDRNKPITQDEIYKINESAVEKIDSLVEMAHKYKLHVSLTLHRAPGYCINAGFVEPYDLWKDQAAQDAFCFHWRYWARKYKTKNREQISFDLLNEPCMRDNINDQHSHNRPLPPDLYKMVVSKAVSAIRNENEDHLIVADGNNVGNDPVPELAELNIAQSCRGYFPHAISHFKAPWANKNPDNQPTPVYPGKINDRDINRAVLQKYYQPWIDLMKSGVGIHCGECGAWNKTPHNVFLAWFGDVLEILKSNNIGFAIWEFVGDFGILNSNRKDVDYKDWHGYHLDKKLLTLLQNS